MIVVLEELVVRVSALFDVLVPVLPVLRLRVLLPADDSNRIDSSALAMTLVSVSSS